MVEKTSLLHKLTTNIIFINGQSQYATLTTMEKNYKKFLENLLFLTAGASNANMKYLRYLW